MTRKMLYISGSLAILLLFYGIMSCSTCTGNGEENNLEELISKIVASKKTEREEAERIILEHRKKLIKALIPVIDAKNAGKYSEEARAVAIYVAGELRASEAVPALSSALANEPMQDEAGRPKKGINSTSRYFGCVPVALIRIGRPCVPQLIKNLRTDDRRVIRNPSIVILSRILGGKAHVMELIDKLIEREKTTEVKERLQKVKLFAERYLKEDEAPLY